MQVESADPVIGHLGFQSVKMIQEHVGCFLVVIDEQDPFMLGEKMVPCQCEVVDLPGIVFPQVDNLESEG
jgi:hypothetical protein